MCSSNEVNSVVMRKRFGDVRPEKIARSTGRKPPTSYFYVGKESVSGVTTVAHVLFKNVRITKFARHSRKERKEVCVRAHHLGRTTEGRTLHHHEGPPASYQ
jgi:hypothetical protein